MKAVTKITSGPGGLTLQERTPSTPGEDEVLLKIGAAGICGTDIHIVAGEYPVNPPVTLGHEFAGTIIGLGAAVVGWELGDRVTSLPYADVCGRCIYCQSGEFGLCAERRSYGSGVHGAFAEYLTVKASGLYRLSEQQDFISGCLTEPLACCTKAAYGTADLQAGEIVAVIGPGTIGLLMTQVARTIGAEVILIGLTSDESRLELGRKFGASHVLYADSTDFLTQFRVVCDPEGVDVVFECSGSVAGFPLALEIVRKRGRVVQVGLFGKPFPVDVDRLVIKDLTLRGSFASSLESWKQAMQLTGSGQIDTRSLVSDVFPLLEWKQAFERATDRSGLKVVFQPESG